LTTVKTVSSSSSWTVTEIWLIMSKLRLNEFFDEQHIKKVLKENKSN